MYFLPSSFPFFSVACTAFDLQDMCDRLSDHFKPSLSEALLKRFLYEFHSASYHLLNEVVMGLGMILGHLTKVLLERPTEDYSDLENETVFDFMLNLYEHLKKHSDVLREIGIQSAQPSHLACLADLPLTAAYSCLTLFFGWVQDGFYDFSSLPFPLKVHMCDQDRLLLDEQLRPCWQRSVGDLKGELQQLTDVLKHSEQDIIIGVKEDAHVCV